MKHDLKKRASLTPMVIKLFDHWKLTGEEQAAALGLRSVRTIDRYRSGGAFANRGELMERVGHLLAIHESLRILFPGNRNIVYGWVKSANGDFNGKRPLDVMISDGLLGIQSVRRYLEFQRER